MSDLNKLLAFCVEHDLIDSEVSERVACENDRYWSSPMEIVLNSGVDESKLFERASKVSNLNLIKLKDIDIDKSVLNIISLNIAAQLHCVPYSLNSSVLKVVIYDWDKFEVASEGTANVTGEKVHVDLITYTEYKDLYEKMS
jgi:hypothetical protein